MDVEIIDLTDSLDVELTPPFTKSYDDNLVNSSISDEVNDVKVAFVHVMETDDPVVVQKDADDESEHSTEESADLTQEHRYSESPQGSPNYVPVQETDCINQITILSVETVKEDDTTEGFTSEKPIVHTNNEITEVDKIEVSSEDETDDRNLDESFNEDTVSEEKFSVEELRKKIAAQLDSLRTRKNLDMLKTIKQTVVVDKPPSFPKQVHIADIIENTIESILPIPDPQIRSDSASSAHESQEDAPNNVFNEIRKIINKPKSNKQSFETPANLPPTEKIYPRNIEDLLDKKHLNLDKNDDVKGSSPFVSITLDEFLNNAKLNVSYAIPKSGAEEGLTRNYPGEPITPVQSPPRETSSKEKSKLEVGYKPKTLAEKRRLLELDNMKRKRRRKSVPAKTEDNTQDYVLFRNKRIYVKSENSHNKCLAVVESTQEEPPKVTRFRKPSLIQQSQLKYAPGPLSKKHLLQNDYSEFSSEIKKLPSVQLSVTPEVGRPVHPNLIPVVTNKWNSTITAERAEFSLTALATSPEPNKAVFTFDVPYKNQQETFLVRRKIPQTHPAVSSSEEIGENVLDEVKKTIDGLISYVEIKEIGDGVIKEERIDINDSSVKVDEEIIPGKKKKVYQRLNKVSRELRRLNCKVLSLEANDSKVNCRKPHCRLGCVCKSLQCDTIIGLHCRQVKCIFGCVCPERQTDLSLDTAIRIGDEAKRNLAKEEKEFTQTIIYSNDKPIVVGPGRKSRRARVPIKYSDYVDNDNEAIWTQPTDTSPCTVSLENWNFSKIIPYCLVHNLYNCHCHGLSTNLKRTIKKPKYLQQSPKPKVTCAPKTKVALPTISDTEPVSCARTSEIPSKYINYRSALNWKTATLWDFAKNFDETDVHLIEIAVTKKKQLTECEAWKKTIIEENQLERQRQESSKSSRVKHTRKQQLNVRQEEPIFNPVFDGEVMLSNNKILKDLGVSLKQPLKNFARILPWPALLKGFTTKTINVYCMVSAPLRLVLNTGAKIVEDKLLDITTHGTAMVKKKIKGTDDTARQSQKVVNMISWLLTGKISGEHNPSTLSFLLIESMEGRFEIRGVCTPKQEKRGDLSMGLTRGISRCRYKLRSYVEQGSAEPYNDLSYIWAGLPDVKNNGKWRMVYIDEKFVYLHFKKISYVLKYDDLIYLSKAAGNDNVTYRLRAGQMAEGYSHTQFGVFITSVHSDRIFIGPYSLEHDDEDVETLKYVDNTLVSTQTFQKVKTKSPKHGCGYWIIERDPKKSETNQGEVVDLTGPFDVKRARLCSEPTNKLQLINHTMRVKASLLRATQEFNRYIITNIPHFGYLGAYQPENSPVLQVSWPLENKYLQFERTEHAVNFIEERFSELLLPVPETFKIRVIVLTDLDLEGMKPIDAEILAGHWVCGQFGIYNFKTIDEDFCKEKMNMSRKEIMKMFTDRSYVIMSKRFNQLVAALGIVEPDSFFEVLHKATAEIKTQEQRRLRLLAEKEELERSVVENTKKVFSLIEPLPQEEKTERTEEVNKIIAIRTKRLTLSEIIEIRDDDPTNSDASSGPSGSNVTNVTPKSKPTCTVTAPEEN